MVLLHDFTFRRCFFLIASNEYIDVFLFHSQFHSVKKIYMCVKLYFLYIFFIYLLMSMRKYHYVHLGY